MFTIVSMEETLKVAPEALQKPLDIVVSNILREKFLDKVIENFGLCVALHDIQSIEGGFIFPGDGSPNFSVKFCLVTFNPFVGEVLVGKLKKSNKSGIMISLGFFEDIHVPEHLMQAPSEFDEEENLWVWKFNGNDMFLDLNETIRFKVVQVKYPPMPIDATKGSEPFAPMQIVGDINADGLGLICWW